MPFCRSAAVSKYSLTSLILSSPSSATLATSINISIKSSPSKENPSPRQKIGCIMHVVKMKLSLGFHFFTCRKIRHRLADDLHCSVNLSFSGYAEGHEGQKRPPGNLLLVLHFGLGQNVIQICQRKTNAPPF